MSRAHTFYVAPDSIHEDYAVIGGDKARQIVHVLRLGVGAPVRLIDGAGSEYAASISGIRANEVSVRILGHQTCDADEPVRIVVAACMPKSDKLEWIVQKCTELGAGDFVICHSERAVPTPHDERIDRRLARWRKIAEEASEQCGRATIPIIKGICTFQEMIHEICGCDVAMFAHCSQEQKTVRDALNMRSEPPRSVGVVIGPEGGLTTDEVTELLASSLVPVTLGPRILRCETAAVTAVASILFHLNVV